MLLIAYYVRSFWRPCTRSNIVTDVSYDVPSDEEETDSFFRLVNGNWWDNVSRSYWLVWNSRAKLFNRRSAIGQFNALSDVVLDQETQEILVNVLNENLMKIIKSLWRRTSGMVEKKCSSKIQKQNGIKRFVTMGEEHVKIIFQLSTSCCSSPYIFYFILLVHVIRR